MAELNFGLLNPPGSQSIGNAFVQGMDQAAAARAQENQNAMAQYTLGKAKREDLQQNELYNAVRQPGFKLDFGTAMRFGAPGLAAYKAQQDANKSDVDIAYTQARTGAIPAATAKTLAETEKFQRESRNAAIGEVASLPDFDAANAAIDSRLANKSITQDMADEMRQGLTSENFTKWKHNTLMRLSTPADQLRQSAVQTKDTDRGGYIERQTYDAQGMAIGDPIRINKTLTPGQVQTSADAKLAREQSARQFTAGGYTYDLPAGVRYDRNGVAQPLMQQAPAADAAAPASSGVPVAPASGGVPAGRNAPGLVPVGARPDKPTDTYYKESKGIINTNYAINNLKEITNNFTAADMLNPARRAEIEAAHAAAVLLAKDMFGLGVLNEGDERILKKIIPDATSFSKGLVPIETIRKNLSAATNVINRMNETSAKVHKQPLLKLDSMTPSAPDPSAPPIQSFRRP